MDFAGRLKTSGAVVQQGSDNVAVAITHSERRYEYTASELDLYDMGEMRTVQLGDSNVHLQITQTSTMPDSTEGTQGVQESDGGVARSQHMASCPQPQVATEPYQHRVEPCMHFKVHTKTGVIQFGPKCVAVNVRIFKENFDYLLKHGTLRVTEPDSNKELLRLSWKNNVKRFKTLWMLKFQKSLQKLETDILRGIRDQSVILKDYSNVESFIKVILNNFGAQFTNMSFCCFLLEFQHDSMDSVASMLKAMDSLKSCVVELLESALPQGQRLPAESLGFDLTSCVVDGYDVNVQELKEKFSSGIEKPQGQRSETQSKTGSLGSFDTDASIGEMSRTKYQTEPTSLEEPSSLPQRENSSRRSDERSGSKQTSERMDHINRWLDEKFKTHEDMTKKNEDQLAGIKSKVDQLLVMMQQLGTPLDPNQGLQFSGATSEKLKDMFTPSVQNHPGSLQSADRQKADTKLSILTEFRGTPGLPTTHAVVNRVVVDYSSPPTSQMPPQSGNQAGTPAGASASTTGATMTPSASSSAPSSVAAGGRLGAGQGMPAQSSLHANPPFGKQTGLQGAGGGHSNLQTGQGSTVVMQAGIMGEPTRAALALPPLKPNDDRDFTVSDGKERRGAHASLPMEERQETIRKHGQDISWKHSKMDSGVDIDASTSFKMKLDLKDMPENHGLSEEDSEFQVAFPESWGWGSNTISQGESLDPHQPRNPKRGTHL